MFSSSVDAFRATAIVSCLCSACMVFAQDADQEIEEVIVLGSLIPRADYSAISPVYTIDREALELDSRETMAELLNRYPQFRPGPNGNFMNLTNPRSGSTSLNLRGLGPTRTLTLLNGRRIGPSGTDGQVDINMLPVGLIQRVEVLTGGASSSYGADAISGVVNFTLRDKVEDIELDATVGRTDRGDGDTVNISLLGGTTFAEGRGQITGFLGYFDAEAISASEREYSAQVIAENRNTGELFIGGSSSLPGGWSRWPAVLNGKAAPDGLTFDRQGNPVSFTFPQDLYNPNSAMDMQSAVERKTGGAFLDYQFNDALELSLALLLTDKNTLQTFAPSPLFFGPLLINLGNPLLTPATREVLATNYDPTGIGFIAIPYNYRTAGVGNRTRNYDQTSSWFNAELRGQWSSGWHWNMAYTRSEADMALDESGGASPSRLQQAVLVNPDTGQCFITEGNCSPADIFGPGRLSAEAADFIREAPFVTREDSHQQVLSLRTIGTFNLADWRDTAIALGLEFRRDEGSFKPDQRLKEASSFAGYFETFASKGTDDVAEVYGEMLLPLIQQSRWAQLLELELGLRYSDYSKIGSEWTWKTGLNWEVTSGLRLRGTYQRAARAPTLNESYQAYEEFEYNILGVQVSDPCAASNRPQDSPGRAELCIEQGIAPQNLAQYEPAIASTRVVGFGGNQDLEIEVADTYTLGVVWAPETLPGVSLSLDYYNIDLENFIFYLDNDESFILCFLTGKAGGFCDGIERSPQGDITRLQETYYNLGGIQTTGYDLNLNYALPHQAPWGWNSVFEISVIGSKLDSFEVNLGQGESRECSGRFGSFCRGVVAKYRALTRLHYRSGPVSAALSWQWLDGVESDNSLRIPQQQYNEAVKSVGSEDYLDFNLSWSVSDAATVSFTVTNLTDNSPPLLGGNQIDINTAPSVYDVLGRRYQAGLNIRF